MNHRRPDIEGLRAVAILLVILYHAKVPGFSGGFVGVDVFFAISGYLITGILVREYRERQRIDLAAFYARRVRRLLPAACLTIGATLLASWWLMSPLDLRSQSRSALAATTYLSNVWFAIDATDYLAAPPETDPYLHMWSLAVEEQFYLVWPVLALLILRFRTKVVTGLTLALVFASLALTVWLQSSELSNWAFFGTPARAWEFGVGALGAIAGRSLPAQAAWFGLAGVVLPAVSYDANTVFPGLAAIPPTLGTVAILMTAGTAVHRVLERRPLQFLGSVSYGWYLWHWPLLVFARNLNPHLTVWAGVGLSAAALGLAVITYKLIESPIRGLPFLVPRPRLTLAGAGLLTVTTLAAVLVWRALAANAVTDPRVLAFETARRDTPWGELYASGCHLKPDTNQIKLCVFGVPESPTTIVLWGDSHAAHWFPGLERAATESGWRLILMTKALCPAADLATSASCVTWRKESLAKIRSLQPDLVLLASASLYLDPSKASTPSESDEGYRAAVGRTLTALEGIPAAMMLPIPRPGTDVPRCLARSSWQPYLAHDCAFPRRHPNSFTADRDVAQRFPNVSVIDMTTAVCPTDPCRPIANGVVVYHDNHHLTKRFSLQLAPALRQAIAPLVRRPALSNPVPSESGTHRDPAPPTTPSPRDESPARGHRSALVDDAHGAPVSVLS